MRDEEMQKDGGRPATESDHLLGAAKTKTELDGVEIGEQENTLLETITENAELITEHAQEVVTDIKEAIVEECQAIADEVHDVKEQFVDALIQKDDGEWIWD